METNLALDFGCQTDRTDRDSRAPKKPGYVSNGPSSHQGGLLAAQRELPDFSLPPEGVAGLVRTLRLGCNRLRDFVGGDEPDAKAAASRIARKYAIVEPLPLVPAT